MARRARRDRRRRRPRALARAASCGLPDIDAYVGPHIGPCHYEVDERNLSQFVNRFGTFARAESGGLDLGFVVAASLQTAGVDPCRIVSLGICTAETTDRFFSYRAEAGPTGRHCALACVLSPSSSLVARGGAVCRGCRGDGGAENQLIVTGSTTILPIAEEAGKSFEAANEGTSVLVSGMGSSAGIEAVSTGTSDIGTSSRDLKDEEEGLGLSTLRSPSTASR